MKVGHRQTNPLKSALNLKKTQGAFTSTEKSAKQPRCPPPKAEKMPTGSHSSGDCPVGKAYVQSREGISNSASPSSTTVDPTEHTVEKTARRFSVFNSLTVTRATTVSPILTGALNFSVCDR